MGITFSQFFPPTPVLTEVNLASQKGKVFIVTGGASGVGFELCKILYQADGRVYIAGRSEKNADIAIQKIREESAPCLGELLFLYVSLDDLSTIKPAAERFMAAESRLDVLFNNAGVSNPPRGSVSAQGHELQMGTNCLGPYLFTQLLLSILIKSAKSSPSASVRVIWTSSIVVDLSAPKDGIDMAKITDSSSNQQDNYAISKTGNWFLASQLAFQAGPEGILSLTLNPGNLQTPLTRHFSRALQLLVSPLLYQPKYGAYTNLWAGFSTNLTSKDGGGYVIPWGRIHPSPRADLVAALATKDNGGTGVAKAFVDWCEEQTSNFR